MDELTVYRDDGPLATGLGRLAGTATGRLAVVMTLVGAVPLAVVLAVPGSPVRTTAVGFAVGWFVVLAGMASGPADRGRLGWVVPPLLRIAEYVFVLRMTAVADPDALPLCFAVLCALAYHHYDTVYRMRHQRRAPAGWLQMAGLGWDLRLVVVYALVATETLSGGLLLVAVALGALFVIESIVGWLRFTQGERPVPYDDEDENE